MTPAPFDRPCAGSALEPVILIVNADAAARRWIEATVTSAGLPAHSFPTAAELMSGFMRDRPACVILDVALPDADGLELQQELTHAGASIVFLTREHCIPTCVRAVRAGAVDFLIMPCDAGRLVRALRAAVREALFSRMQRVHLDELMLKYDSLTSREREVLLLVSMGLLNKQIAQRLEISEITVQIHRSRMMKKMAARSLAALVRMADALRSMYPNAWEVLPSSKPVPVRSGGSPAWRRSCND